MPTKRIYLAPLTIGHLNYGWDGYQAMPCASDPIEGTVPFEPAVPRCGAPKCEHFALQQNPETSEYDEATCSADAGEFRGPVPTRPDGSGYCWRHSSLKEKRDVV